MKINENIKITAPPEAVWPYVADPILMASWNDKIVDVQRDADQPVRLNEQFTVTYRMNQKDSPSQVRVTTCEPGQLVEFEHTLPPMVPRLLTASHPPPRSAR